MTASATASAAAAAAAKAAKNKTAAAAPDAAPAGEAKKPGRKPKLDDAGNPVPRPPAKPLAERLADAKAKLENFDAKAKEDRAKLEQRVLDLESKAAPKVASKDEVLAAAPSLGKTPAEIKANVAKQIAKLKAISAAAGEMTDEDFAGLEDEQPEGEAEGTGLEDEQPEGDDSGLDPEVQ